MKKYQVEQPDGTNVIIKKIYQQATSGENQVGSTNEFYIFYRDEYGAFRYGAGGKYRSRLAPFTKYLTELAHFSEKIASFHKGKLKLGIANKDRVYALISSYVASFLNKEGSFENGSSIEKENLKELTELKKYLTNEIDSLARYYYTLKSLTLFLVFVIVAIFVWFYESRLANSGELFIHFSENFSNSVYLAAAGATGAFISVTQKINNLKADLFLPQLRSNLDSKIRILLGALFGILLVWMIKSNFIQIVDGSKLGFNSLDSALLSLLVAAVGGFSERIVPDIFSKKEKDYQSENSGNGDQNRSHGGESGDKPKVTNGKNGQATQTGTSTEAGNSNGKNDIGQNGKKGSSDEVGQKEPKGDQTNEEILTSTLTEEERIETPNSKQFNDIKESELDHFLNQIKDLNFESLFSGLTIYTKALVEYFEEKNLDTESSKKVQIIFNQTLEEEKELVGGDMNNPFFKTLKGIREIDSNFKIPKNLVEAAMEKEYNYMVELWGSAEWLMFPGARLLFNFSNAFKDTLKENGFVVDIYTPKEADLDSLKFAKDIGIKILTKEFSAEPKWYPFVLFIGYLIAEISNNNLRTYYECLDLEYLRKNMYN
ncbi:hypothetical protein [Kriegella aquimaris]|uniref:Uncharacterized protein n=1 Tax=Kriegella aquimaris TaxID=192904 RepID=A0A1G9RDQ4_9FLAO|nr:hypothetical protein [Kriegella aquimaris]SDM21311.1 hypothetical protein SAMN04488514_10694 [Kriegella aquimaris]